MIKISKKSQDIRYDSRTEECLIIPRARANKTVNRQIMAEEFTHISSRATRDRDHDRSGTRAAPRRIFSPHPENISPTQKKRKPPRRFRHDRCQRPCRA